MVKKVSCFVLIVVLTMSVLVLSACSKKEVCSVDGCDNEVYQDGLCADHYVANALSANPVDSEDSDSEAIETITIIDDIDESAEESSEPEDSSVLKTAEYQEIIDGEIITVDDRGEFYVDFSDITARVIPPAATSYYSYYDAGDGKLYVDLCISYKNLDSSKRDASEVINATLLYSNTYEFRGTSIIEESNRSDFTYTSITSIAPLTTEYLHYIFKVPEEVVDSTGSYLR